MLDITIPATELFDPLKDEFMEIAEQKIVLEHSLVSVSKWEAKWHKPFINPGYKMTLDELYSYIECMCITKNVLTTAFKLITPTDIERIKEYINDPMTATIISNGNSSKKKNGKFITNEEIYYMMFSYQIPKECEKWHLNRLMTLLEVFAAKNNSNEKMSKAEIYKQNAQLTAARRAKWHSKG